jgi:hypothetical protein
MIQTISRRPSLLRFRPFITVTAMLKASQMMALGILDEKQNLKGELVCYCNYRK